MTTQSEQSPDQTSPGPSPAAVVATVGLLGIAALVFVVLPRWSVPPVVTTSAPPSSPLPPATLAPARSSPAVPAPPVDTPPDSRADSRPTLGEPRLARPAPLEQPASDFDAVVSEGLAALDRGAAAEARTAFTRADALRPGTEVVKDGLSRSEAGLRAEALEGHRTLALAAEAADDWRTAVREYEAALRLEPAVRFAVEGALRAGQRVDASDRLDLYLRRPDRLGARDVAHEAEIALDRASEIPSPGPQLLRQMAELRAHLDTVAVAVPVHLISDERTDVSVLRVGSLGRFREMALKLRPGSYVVVGTRPGYRDKRHTLVVPPGRSPEPLTVRCDESL